MNAKIKQSIFLIFATALAGFFIYITAQKIDFDHVKVILKKTNYFWIFLSMFLSIVSYWIRAKRWNLLLNPIGLHPKTINNFWSIAFGYFMNLTIPRSGEVARATSLYKTENVPVDKTFGTIVLERVIDLVCLLTVIGLSFIFNYEILQKFLEFGNRESSEHPTEKASSNLIYIAIAVLLGVIILGLFWRRLKRTKLFDKVKNFLLGILEGLKSISKLKKRREFIVWSILLWVCYFLMTYVVFFAFPDTQSLGLREGLFLLVAGSFGMILPVTGGLGYPYIMSIAFAAMYTINQGDAESGRQIGDYFGLILYLAQIISMITFGLIAMFFISKNKTS